MCGHPFIEKTMFITEPAVLSARILGLGSNCLQATCHACPRDILFDSCRVFVEHAKTENGHTVLLSHQDVKLSFVSIRWDVKAH